MDTPVPSSSEQKPEQAESREANRMFRPQVDLSPEIAAPEFPSRIGELTARYAASLG